MLSFLHTSHVLLTACTEPLGMESGLIKDAQITASSQYDANHAAIQARLNFLAGGGKAGGWSTRSNNPSQWIQIDLGRYTKVTQVVTQGRNAYNQWVTKYKLQYSEDGLHYRFYHEQGQNLPKVYTTRAFRTLEVYPIFSSAPSCTAKLQLK